jgi:hypothetical protein
MMRISYVWSFEQRIASPHLMQGKPETSCSSTLREHVLPLRAVGHKRL